MKGIILHCLCGWYALLHYLWLNNPCVMSMIVQTACVLGCTVALHCVKGIILHCLYAQCTVALSEWEANEGEKATVGRPLAVTQCLITS